jgi:hypothetical protein
MLDPRARWLTPKNLLIAFLLVMQAAVLLFLLWNEIDAERHPALTIDPPCVTAKGRP